MNHLIDILIQPREVFRQIVKKPNRSWLIPALMNILVLALVSIVGAPLLQEETIKSLQGHMANLSPEYVESYQTQLATLASPVFIAITSFIGGSIFLTIIWFLRSGILFLISSIVGDEKTFGQNFSILLWASVPSLVQGLVQCVYITLNGNLIQNQGLSFLVATGDPIVDSHNMFYAFLSTLDVFVIWSLVLIGIGFLATGRLSKSRAALATFSYWALSTLLALVPFFIASLSR